MYNTRKELNDLEMSFIISKKLSVTKINYGVKMKSGEILAGNFKMNRKPKISSLLGHLFRLN